DPLLHEALVAVRVGAAGDGDGGAPADPVLDVLVVEDDRHLEQPEQSVVERHARLEGAHPEPGLGEPVDLHAPPEALGKTSRARGRCQSRAPRLPLARVRRARHGHGPAALPFTSNTTLMWARTRSRMAIAWQLGSMTLLLIAESRLTVVSAAMSSLVSTGL